MQIGIVCSLKDVAAVNMADHLIKEYGFKEAGSPGMQFYELDGLKLYKVDVSSWAYEDADSLNQDLLFFLSGHRSAGGVPALTTHSMGNWNTQNKYGGKPKELSVAAPFPMLSALNHLNAVSLDVAKIYEATHHGPLLKTPSLFLEFGGTDQLIADVEVARKVADSAYKTILEAKSGTIANEKIAIGIGSGHYPEKFSKLALEKGYAFSYIMPKYAMENEDGSDNIDMIRQAVERTDGDVDTAVIDWKGLKGATRSKVIAELNAIGLDYEKA